MTSRFRGTGALLPLALRLDRVRLPVWILSITALMVVSARSVTDLYSTPEQIAGYVAISRGNATVMIFNGPGIGFDDPSIGVVVSQEATVWGAVGCALMAVFLLVRHTRAEEEAERTDLLGARMVGRHAQLLAAVILTASAAIAVGVLSAGGLVATGLPAAGSMAIGAGIAATGLAFTGIAAMAAQFTSTARGALGLGAGAIGLAYGMRAVGDVGAEWLSWLSPLGWAHRVRPFAGERWWVLLLPLATFAALVTAAGALSTRRDLGSGILAERPGPGRAATSLGSPWGLALRLQRASVMWWAVSLFVLGLTYGSFGNEIESMLEDNPQLATYMSMVEGVSVTDSYLAYTLLFGALLCGGFATAATLRFHSEEAAGRAESVLATATSRAAWAGGHTSMALGGAVVLLAASGLGTGIGLALTSGDGSQVLRMTVASLAFLPGVLVLIGFAMGIAGALPRVAPLAWVGLGVAVLVGVFAGLLDLPRWTLALSPFDHLASVPAEPFAPVPAAVLVAIASVLAAVGFAGLQHRDIAGT